jgi:adenosylcobinamide amidohydrolase
LVVHFAEPHTCLSWAAVNGGRVQTGTVAWYYLSPEEQPHAGELGGYLRLKLDEAHLHGAIGMLTTRKRYGHTEASAEWNQIRAWTLATVGLRNAVRVGDEPSAGPAAATVNLLCQVSLPLTDTAMLEAVSIAAEARTAAILEATVPSVLSGKAATGTPSDCIVIACPPNGLEDPRAGKGTDVGHVIGRTVYDAVTRGVREWNIEDLP